MVEVMANVEKDIKNNPFVVEGPGLSKKWGTVSTKLCSIARKAIKEGTDFYIATEHFANESTRINGNEIKEWGLDLDTLLIKPKDKDLERLEQLIL